MFLKSAFFSEFAELKQYLHDRELPPVDVNLAMDCIRNGGHWNTEIGECE
jgi:hypothetical protein